MAKSKKSEGLGASLAAGLKNILGGGKKTETASTTKATPAKRGRKPKQKAPMPMPTPAKRGRKPKQEAPMPMPTPAKRGRKPKANVTPIAKPTPEAKAPKESLKTKFKPRDLNRVEKRSKIKKGKSGQTARGKKQDTKFIALPAGTRKASSVSMITKKNGTSFSRRNPRAVEGNLYTEKRKNRADVFGKVARMGGKM